MAIRGDAVGGDDSEDDDDLIIGLGENFRKHIDALKRACVLEVGIGGYISTPASIISGEIPPACEEDDDEEDDDELLLSIQSKYGDSQGFGNSTSEEKKPGIVANREDDGEEQDDEEILRSVEKLYKNESEGGQREGVLPEVVSPLKVSKETDSRKCDGKIYPSSSPPASPEFESGGTADGECGVLSPQRQSEASVELVGEVGKSIASFLPGSWIDTDGDVDYGDVNGDFEYGDANGDVEYGNANPAAPVAMVAIEEGTADQSPAPEKPKEYRRPEHAHVLMDALKKNKECQRTLRNALSEVEAKQKENAELQKRVRSLVYFEKYCHRRFAGFFTDQANPSVKLIACKAPAPQNKSSDSSNKTVSDLQICGPPENPDVEIFKKLQKNVSFTFPTRRWSNEDRTELSKGVKQQVYEVLVREAMDALSNADALDEEFSSLEDHMSKIGEKEFTPQQIRDAVPGIDWGEVARLYVVGRTPEECRTRWINHEDSLINNREWKKLEDKKLLSIAQQHNFCTWETIAEQLGTNRTPADCLTRYQRSLNASIMRSNWTPEEDSRLRVAVEEWGENDWSAVAACLEGRNNSQCLMRWYKVLHPTKKKSGRWSVEEDKRLKWAVSVYGPKKWKQIAEHVPGRTDLQCRERWCNVLDPGIKLGEWTEDEDQILEASVAKHGPHRWAAVANDLKIRTDNQCCRRWKFLHPEDQPEFRRTVHIRRTALVGNFQGRRKERPGLGPQDFISKGTDFEDTKKAGAKRPATEKDRPRETPKTLNPKQPPRKQRRRKQPVEGEAMDTPKERRAARIIKRRLARAKKASSNGNRAQLVASAPNAQIDNALVDVLAPNETLRPGAVNTESGPVEKLGEETKRKADRMRRLARAKKTSNRERAHTVASAPNAQIGNALVGVLEPNDTGRPGALNTEAGPVEKLGEGTKRKADQIRRLARARKTSTRDRAELVASAPNAQIDNALVDVVEPNDTLRPGAVDTESGGVDKSEEGTAQKADQISDHVTPSTRAKRPKRSAVHVGYAHDPSDGAKKGGKRKVEGIEHAVGPCKLMKLKVRRCSQSVGASASQDTSRET